MQVAAPAPALLGVPCYWSRLYRHSVAGLLAAGIATPKCLLPAEGQLRQLAHLRQGSDVGRSFSGPEALQRHVPRHLRQVVPGPGQSKISPERNWNIDQRSTFQDHLQGTILGLLQLHMRLPKRIVWNGKACSKH